MGTRCTDKCYSPTACGAFGYCRNLNQPFDVERLIVPPIFITRLTGQHPEFVTIRISARNQKTAERIADDHPDWFNDDHAIVARRPFAVG